MIDILSAIPGILWCLAKVLFWYLGGIAVILLCGAVIGLILAILLEAANALGLLLLYFGGLALSWVAYWFYCVISFLTGHPIESYEKVAGRRPMQIEFSEDEKPR